jgi:hypothetical protein
MRSCPKTGPHGANLAPGRSSSTFSSGSAVLQRETHQAGNHVVEADQFRRTVRAFHSKKNFCRLLVVMDADVKRALAGDFDFMCDCDGGAG